MCMYISCLGLCVHVCWHVCSCSGINWLAGVLTAVIDSVVVWYIFIVLCGLQGLYVFIAFVCNKRVLSLYKDLFTRRQKRAGSGTAQGQCEIEVQESEN